MPLLADNALEVVWAAVSVAEVLRLVVLVPWVAASDLVPEMVTVSEVSTLVEVLSLLESVVTNDEDCVTDEEDVCGQYCVDIRPNVTSAANTLKRSRLRTASPL